MFKYKELPAERDITSTNFVNGEVAFRWRMPRNTQINMGKSYIRAQYKITLGDDSVPEYKDLIAPSYLFAHNLWRSMEQRINGRTVSSLNNFISQVAALKHRMTTPQSMKDTFLQSTNHADPEYYNRLSKVVSDGYDILKEKQWLPFTSLLVGNLNALPTSANYTISFAQLNNTYTIVGANIDIRRSVQAGDLILTHDNTVRIITTVDQNSFQIDERGASGLDAGSRIYRQYPLNVALNYVDLFIAKRVNLVKESRSEVLETCFKPPLSIWDQDMWVPSHDFELIMNSHASGTLETSALQTVGISKGAGTTANDSKIEFVNMIMYCAVRDKSYESGDLSVTFDDCRCQAMPITSLNSTQYHFQIESIPRALTIALQDENVENSSMYQASNFKIRQDEHLNLSSYYIDYNNQILPNPYPVMSSNLMTQRYYETMYYSNSVAFKDIEPLELWKDVGPYYCHTFIKPSHRSPKVSVTLQFSEEFVNGHRPNLLLFEHYKSSFKLDIQNGRISQVSQVSK